VEGGSSVPGGVHRELSQEGQAGKVSWLVLVHPSRQWRSLEGVNRDGIDARNSAGQSHLSHGTHEKPRWYRGGDDPTIGRGRVTTRDRSMAWETKQAKRA